MYVNIPFCYLPNTKFQRINVAECKRSTFQLETLQAISHREDFAYFVTCIDGGVQHVIFPEFGGPYQIMFYTKDGMAHTMRIGKNRILNSRAVGGSRPAGLDDPVYKSRTY